MNVALPSGITNLIREGLEQINNHSDYCLLPAHRRRIYEALDVYAGSNSHLIKIWCGILTTRRVLTLWNTNVEEEENGLSGWWESHPEEMLRTTETLIHNQDYRKSAGERLAEYQEMSDLTGELMDSPYFVRWCIFDAGLSTLREAVYPQAWQEIGTTDFDGLGHNGDTAKYASLAYAGGTWNPTDPNKWFLDEKKNLWIPKDEDAYYYFDENRGNWDWHDSTVRMKRKEFWEWWLKEAISDAWHETL